MIIYFWIWIYFSSNKKIENISHLTDGKKKKILLKKKKSTSVVTLCCFLSMFYFGTPEFFIYLLVSQTPTETQKQSEHQMLKSVPKL